MRASSFIFQALLATTALAAPASLTDFTMRDVGKQFVSGVHPVAFPGVQPFNVAAASAGVTNENTGGLVLTGPDVSGYIVDQCDILINNFT